MRPKKIGFLDGIRFHTKTTETSTVSMLLTGLSTLTASIIIAWPLAFCAYYLGLSNYSSNPIQLFEAGLAHSPDVSAIFLHLLLLVIVVPLVEEGFVRGFLFDAMRQQIGVVAAIAATAIFFAAIHFDPGGMLPLFGYGVVWAYVAEKRKSIVPGMIAHALMGGFSLVQSLIYSQT